MNVTHTHMNTSAVPHMGDKLKARLRELGLTQSDLARKVGLTRQEISRLADTSEWEVSTVRRYASVLRVPITYFFQ